MLKSVLIANRGEIACRIIRTARRLGLRTIAVYSEADRGALHVRLADEAIHIGPAPSNESYLVAERVLDAAKLTKADAIHPGYGFLSENAAFSEACAQNSIVFIGPDASSIRAMGLKDGAKALMEKAGVPVVPGYHGERQEVEFLKRKAYEIGYPVLIKAVAGGGGKGMRRVDKAIEFDGALEAAQREALGAFGDARVLIEKFIVNPRHVEIQVFGDAHGNVVHLFERDCSAQRRHQKVVEEAPAPGMDWQTRAAMGQAAVAAAKAVNYKGAGTVEFIVDGSGPLRPDGFWFMEMNTRLQVEHPVTELITGQDLVEWQFKVASGESLPLRQDELQINGHAVEVRLYAEDPDTGFLPSSGRLEVLRLPQATGVRVDTGVEEGAEVSPFYDPMIAKIITHGSSREKAVELMTQALDMTSVAGPKTNLAFLRALMRHEEMRGGGFDTGLLDRELALLTAGGVSKAAIGEAALRLLQSETDGSSGVAGGEWRDPWAVADGFQLAGAREMTFAIKVDGDERDLTVAWRDGRARLIEALEADVDVDLAPNRVAVASEGGVWAMEGGRSVLVTRVDPLMRSAEDGAEDSGISAPMHGKLIAVFVEEGAQVVKGERLAIVEAMKMEHVIVAPRDGRIESVLAQAGDQVNQGAFVMAMSEIEKETPELA